MPNEEDNPAQQPRKKRAWILPAVVGGITSVVGTAMPHSARLPFVAALIGLCIVVALYQRYVKKRTWQAMLWGDQHPGE